MHAGAGRARAGARRAGARRSDLAAGKVGIGEQLVDQLEELISLLNSGLAAQRQVRDDGIRVADRAILTHRLLVDHCRVDATGARADATLEGDGVELGGADLIKQLREQADEGEVGHWYRREIEEDVGVDDARRWQRVRQQLAAAGEAVDLGRVGLDLALEIGEAHARDRREILRRILQELGLLEGLGRADHAVDLLGGHLGLSRLEHRLLGLALHL